MPRISSGYKAYKEEQEKKKQDQNKKDWAGPMAPASRYEKTGSYDRRKTDKTETKPKPKPKVEETPPPPTNTVYDYVDKDSQIPTSTRKSIEDAPYSPVKKTPVKPKDDVMTSQEYLQERYDEEKQLQKRISHAEKQKESIDPTGWYLIDKQVNGETHQIQVSGSYIIKEYYDPYLEKLRKADQQAQLAYIEAVNLPSDTKVVKTDEGYKFKYRDTSLDWTKEEFKKIDKAYEINPVLGGVAEFGFGAVSSFAALGKPAAEYVAGKMGVETRRTHYVSPMDVVFEPIGWSPKGSTDILKQRPVFSAGGIASEYLQSQAIGQAVKGGVKGVSAGTKLLVKQTIKIGDDIPTIGRLTSSFGKTDFGSNIYKWAVKGYKPVRQMGFSTGKISEKIVDDGLTQTRIITRNFVGKTSGKRVFSSVDDITKTKIIIDKPKTPGIIRQTYEKNMKYKGIFRRKPIIIEKTSYTRWMDDPFKINIKNTDDYIKSYGSINKKIVREITTESTDELKRFSAGSLDRTVMSDATLVSDMAMKESKKGLVSIQKTPLDEMFIKGYSKPTFMESGTIRLEAYSGWKGSKLQPIIKKRPGQWSKPISIISDERATSGFVGIQRQKNLFKKYGTRSFTPHSHKAIIPVSSYGVGLLPAASLKYGLTSSHMLITGVDNIYERESVKRINRLNRYDVERIQDVDKSSMTISAQDYDSMFQQDVISKQKLKVKNDLIFKKEYSTNKPYVKIPSTIPTFRKPPLFYYDYFKPKKKKKTDDFSYDYGKGYRFRTWKVPELEDIIGGY